MAVTNSLTKRLQINGNDTNYQMTFTVTEKELTSTDIANNQSRVDYTIVVKKLSGSGYWTNNNDGYAKVTFDNHSEPDDEQNNKFDFRSNTTKTMISGTYTAPHGDDGKKTLHCHGYFKDKGGNLGSRPAEFDLVLSKINRGTIPSVSSNPATLGNQITITHTRPNISYSHVIKFKVGNTTTILSPSLADTENYTLPLEWANNFPDSMTGTCKLICETYKVGESEPIGTQEIDLGLVIPSSVKPTINIGTPIEADATMISKNWGVFVQNKSKLNIPITVEKAYGSDTSSPITTIDGKPYNGIEITTNTITSSGTLPISSTTTDGRGQTGTDTDTVSVVAYSNPVLDSKCQAQRCDVNGNVDDNGTYILYDFKGSISPVNNKNAKSFKIKYKKSSQPDSSYIEVPISTNYSIDVDDQILKDANNQKIQIDSDYAYDFVFMATDSFITIDTKQILDTGLDLMNFNPSGKSMALGKVSTANANEKKLEVGLDTEFSEDITMTNGAKINGYQESLVSGTNIKTINNNSLLGSGNITITGGSATDVQVNGASITSGGVANIKTKSAYNSSTNKIATEVDIPQVPTNVSSFTNDANYVSDSNYVHTDNNYTTTEKNKLSGIASGAEVNVQANWTETNTSSDAYIKNKPNLSPVATQSTVGSTDRPVYLNNGTATQTNTPASGNYFRGIPFVTSGGVMEIGRYIDFHPTNDSTLDFSKRLDAGSGTNARTLTLPDKTGTIAITNDIPTKTGDLTNNGDGTSGYKYINDIGKDGLYYGDSELQGLGVYEDDHIYFKSINGNHEYIECLANNSDLPTKVSELTNDSGYITTYLNNRRSFYGTCSTAAGTKDKVVTLSDTSGWELKAGTIVGVKFTNTNTYSSSNANPVTLNVNSTGAKNIWYNTTHSGAGNNGTNSGVYGAANRVNYYMYDGTYWVWLNMGSLDGNTVSQLRQENGRVYAGTNGISPYTLIALDNNGAYQSLITTATTGTGTNKTINTGGKFKLDAVIKYYLANNTTTNGNLVPSTYALYSAYPTVDTRYSHNHTVTFATNKPVYIECTIDGNGYWSPTTVCITQTLRSGYYYIYLGEAYSTEYQLTLTTDHPIYYYDGTYLSSYAHKLASGKQNTLVSGTNIKTINGTSLLGSGDIQVGGGVTVPTKTSELTNDGNGTLNCYYALTRRNGDGIYIEGTSDFIIKPIVAGSVINKSLAYDDEKQDTLVSGTNIKTINSTSLLGSGNVSVQPTLVSGTNIKTINSTSLLGSGNIAVQSTLSTTTGTLSITKTSGNSTCTGTYARYGNVVSLDLELKTTGTVNSGADVFVGKITSFTPKKTGELMGYYGARPIIAGYGTDQVITVRNASASNISSGNTLNIRGTIIV